MAIPTATLDLPIPNPCARVVVASKYVITKTKDHFNSLRNKCHYTGN